MDDSAERGVKVVDIIEELEREEAEREAKAEEGYEGETDGDDDSLKSDS